MENNIKIVVVHPGKQHVFHLVNGINSMGFLFKFITTVYDKPNSYTNILSKFLSSRESRKASSRKNSLINDDMVIQYCELQGLLLLALNRLALPTRIKSFFYKIVHRKFALKAANYIIENDIDAVVFFDSNVYEAFKEIKTKSPKTKCILDVTIGSRIYLKEIYANDILVTKDYSLQKEQSFLWNDNNIKSYLREFEEADYLLVASRFVEESLIFSNVDTNKIIKIPYGANIKAISKPDKVFQDKNPLKLLFVGGINRRKGLHHLLQVMTFFTKNQVELTLIGDFNIKDSLFTQFSELENVNFKGFVNNSDLFEYYEESDLFVLPSLAEGFALVGLEALSYGLPILCTKNTGINDIIVNEYNGFVIDASSPIQLHEAINFAMLNKRLLNEMKINCRKTALSYTWENYYLNLGNSLKRILE